MKSRNYSEATEIRKIKLLNTKNISSVQFSEIDMDQLETWDQGRFVIPLESNVEVIVEVTKKYWDDYGRIHITGKIQGDIYGKVHIVSTKKGHSGTITAGGNEYNLMPLGDDLHTIYSYYETNVQTNKHSKALNNLRNKMQKEKAGIKKTDLPKLKTQSTTDNFIDVMVVYTDDVAAASTDPEAVISSHMDYTNQALEDSCANYRMRIVHQEQVSYTETGSAVADLNCVTNPGHGDCGGNNLSTVATLRAAHGADLVQFVTNTSDYCGLAWVGAEPFTSNYGYSQKLFLCAGSTMAHELGHNLGLGHDRYQTGYDPRETSGYGEGHGYVDLINKTRTIMSYNDQCTDLGVTCERIGIYSNPYIRKNGQEQGDFGFTNATNRINETFEAVSSFYSPASSYSVNINESCVSSADSDKDVHCFIATAVYGSYLHKYVVTLKNFRDNVLNKTKFGKFFVEQYYNYSPRIAYFIAERPILKKLTRWLLTPIVFIVAYPSTGVLALLGLIIFVIGYRRKKLLMLIPFLLIMPLEPSNAQVAQPSLFDYQLSKNPAALAAPFRTNYLGYTQNVWSGKASNSTSEQELSGASGLIHGAVMWGTGGIAVQNQPSSSIDVETTMGATKVKNSLSHTATDVNLSIAMFEKTHLGFKYGQSKSTDDDNVSTITRENETSRFGLGLRVQFGELFFLGGSADHVTEKGTITPETKWVEASFGVGISQRAESDSWLVEISATRRPEILNQEDGNVSVYGETLNLGLLLEREMPMTDSMFNTMIIGAFYTIETEKALEPYATEDEKINMTGINLGIKMFNKSLNTTASYIIVDHDYGIGRKDTIIGLTMMYNFSGNIFSLAGVTQ
ncbi:MAG: hypothetical protein KDD58_08575 [Bdellovibrionales bacterium]|nr:hypothetical protein [Bdellovibrionales bacterium]